MTVVTSGSRSRAMLPVAAVGLGALALTSLLALVDPHEPGHYPSCPTVALTGFFCAGCGTLRAMNSLTRLDLAGAWDMNPLFVLAAPFLVLAWFAWARRSWTGTPRRRAMPAWLAWGLLAVVLGFSVLRNVPALAPWLAP